MKKWKHALLSLALVLGMGAVLVPAPTAGAINIVKQSCKDNTKSKAICSSSGEKVFPLIKTGINIALLILGIIAVIMIIIGGFRYVMSAGESSAIKAAKDTIMYAVIGLVVAILAFTIVNFVVGSF